MPATLDAPPLRPGAATADAAVTVADIMEQFGDVPLFRIVMDPAPGTATEEDIARVQRETGRLCELVDGTLIEKAVGAESDLMGGELLTLIRNAIRGKKIGWVLGGQAFLRLTGRRTRAADVAVIRAEQVPSGRFPSEPAYPDLYPDLAIEVLSPSNRPGEMRRKRQDFFAAGTRLIWQIDPAAGTCEVYTSVEAPDETIPADGTLDGRDVVPGLKIPLAAVLGAVELD
ncbi:Uma2 family endonuclease [Alienimonas californiensis]|uniref:Putative restriction endonuclease domain-containing protein n=1 Tax=Alienimonas californiensis TaxID=2527989 RepID=A0A517P7T3_9PLAN|nr:Uma2 family endonuclease [Alienimonas californiensis]QDT15415.1 hypothetical protein CA12_15000 [Alienimonas californiensis]